MTEDIPIGTSGALQPPLPQHSLSWSDVNYLVDTPTQGRLHILNNLSGFALGGRLLAIMGASGSGKTSLLDILCNRRRIGTASSNLTGSVSIDGYKRTTSHTLGYVPQHDTLLNTATVRETFELAARLRIANISAADLKLRVDVVLADLGLTHREDALVGGGEIRSLSGGERRRVSIGTEIVSCQNTVICLDEPTTGLDSSTAESVMACLHDLAKKKGMVIIATIHQPNSNITAMFDDFLLLGKGKSLYLGPYSDAVQRFSDAGFPCPMYCNPADYFISIAANEDNLSPLSELNQVWMGKQQAVSGSHAQIGFRRSTSNRLKSSPSGEVQGEVEILPASTLTQIKLLVVRDARQWIRDPGMLISEFVQYIFFAVFLGGMYWETGNELESGVFDRTASLFLILSLLVFTPPFTAIVTFSGERLLFMKERRDNMYSAFSWLAAKTIVLAPIEALLCLTFSSIYYFMAGYQKEPDKFFLFLAILIVFQLIGESIGLFFATVTSSPVFAVVWLTLFLIIILSLSGFLTSDMPVFYEWIEDSNVLRFGLLGLILNEFSGLELVDSSGALIDGIAALPSSLQPDPDYTVGTYIGILVAFLVGFRLLILFVLMFDDIKLMVFNLKTENTDEHDAKEIDVIEQEEKGSKKQQPVGGDGCEAEGAIELVQTEL
jgi:ABC-type multidrug transport system ATPase subunit/ABC-type multidrug transport system permease subunit